MPNLCEAMEESAMEVETPGVAGSILVADDSATIARLLQAELGAAGFAVTVTGDGQEALDSALEDCPDLVLADVTMPTMGGLELTHRLRSDPRTAGVSIILITATGSAAKLEGLTAGADDYIVKPFDTAELLARVRSVLRRSNELRAQSPLTRLPGNVRIQEELQRRITQHDGFALLYADLDYFKAYNDHYGFARGDEVLQATAELIREVATEVGGPTTFIGHVGGDDFVIVSSLQDTKPIAERLIERFEAMAPRWLKGPTPPLAASELQTLVKGLAEQANAEVRSERILPLVERGGLQEVPIEITVGSGLREVVRLLYDLEHTTKILTVQDVKVRVVGVGQPRDLLTTFTVSGYLLPGAATPAPGESSPGSPKG